MSEVESCLKQINVPFSPSKLGSDGSFHRMLGKVAVISMRIDSLLAITWLILQIV